MRLRVGVLCDMPEERWYSMDLVADQLLQHLRASHARAVEAVEFRPNLRRRLSSVHDVAGPRFALDRLSARFIDYPRLLRQAHGRCDVLHIVDHSYSQLVTAAGDTPTVVTCHDLDTFRSVLEPANEPRSWLFRRMTRIILDGFRRATHIVCDTGAVREHILAHGIRSAEDVSVVPLGVDPVFSPAPDPAADAEVAALLGPEAEDAILLLHVGSVIPRKRIDILLRTVALAAGEQPDFRLVRAGGPLGAAQRALAQELGIADRLVELPFLSPRALAAAYRRASIALLPSEAEGFGLPVLEALASGTPVIASELPVLREVGGEAATYAPVGDVRQWGKTLNVLLDERRDRPSRWEERRQRGIARAAEYSWGAYARRMTDVYRSVAGRRASSGTAGALAAQP